jgi:hypothetical protein
LLSDDLSPGFVFFRSVTPRTIQPRRVSKGINVDATLELAADATCYLRRRAAGEYLKQKFGFGAGATLSKIACVSSDGPLFRRAGRVVLYRREDLDAWALSKIGAPQKSTSDAARVPHRLAEEAR